MRIQLELSDAGCSNSSYKKEKQDCTVKALVHAFGHSYDEAHEILSKLGRRAKCGTDVHIDYLNKHYNARRLISFKPITVRAFLEGFTEGTYLVSIPKHIFVYKDGVIFDSHFYGYYLNLCADAVWKVAPNMEALKPYKKKVIYNRVEE